MLQFYLAFFVKVFFFFVRYLLDLNYGYFFRELCLVFFDLIFFILNWLSYVFFLRLNLFIYVMRAYLAFISSLGLFRILHNFFLSLINYFSDSRISKSLYNCNKTFSKTYYNFRFKSSKSFSPIGVRYQMRNYSSQQNGASNFDFKNIIFNIKDSLKFLNDSYINLKNLIQDRRYFFWFFFCFLIPFLFIF